MRSGEAALSFPERLRQLADAAPHLPTAAMGAATRSRADFVARAELMARALAARGLGPGDLVTIALGNSVEFMETAAACWFAGATPQQVSARLPLSELAGIVALAQSKYVVAEPGLETPVQRLDPAQLLQEGARAPAFEPRLSPCWKAPTSGGSTGVPKLILSGSPAIFSPTMGDLVQISGNDVVLMPGPLYHNGPFIGAATSLLLGAFLVLMPRFDAEEVLREIEARRATWLYLVPTMMSRIIRLPEDVRAKYDVSSLRKVFHVAAPCPPWVKRAWIEWLGGDAILEGYGTTEGQAGTFITGTEWLNKPGSVGRVVYGEIVIRDGEGRQCPPDEPGEVFARATPGAAPTYHYRGAQSKFSDDGWEAIGDIGWLDADGYLFLSDRRRDLILVGGSNVFPAEVEAALEEFPGVQSCAVIGLPDEDLGERVHAIIQADARIDLEALQAHLAARLVRYKLPRSFEIVDHALRDDAGKVRRSQLREERVEAQAKAQRSAENSAKPNV
ncbi:MAG: AMP-binding protein [Hyphomonadaceae bacterium]